MIDSIMGGTAPKELQTSHWLVELYECYLNHLGFIEKTNAPKPPARIFQCTACGREKFVPVNEQVSTIKCSDCGDLMVDTDAFSKFV